MKTDLSSAFFSRDDDKETLASRMTLLDEQVDAVRHEKNNLLAFIKANLSDSLGFKVGYWIQGSFKNHTVIKPVRRTDEFDVDVGLYLFTDAEAQDIEAGNAKSALNDVLGIYCQSHDYATLEKPRPNCERISYSEGFHIDLPLYYITDDSKRCRLATESNGWIDSDPKSLQSWFDLQIKHLSASEKARLRRVIKALKTWVCLKGIKLPSIAISVFVASNFTEYATDEDAVWSVASQLVTHLLSNGAIKSPLNNDDLIDADTEELDNLRSECSNFRNTLQELDSSDSVVTSHQLWSNPLEHTFPPLHTLELENDKTNLPALTSPPQLSVKLSNGTPEKITNSVAAYRGEDLHFKVCNEADYPRDSEVVWMVRNTDRDASLENDLGHYRKFKVSEVIREGCEYHGKHFMECTVLHSERVLGVSSVEVKIRSVKRPERNPPRRSYGPRR